MERGKKSITNDDRLTFLYFHGISYTYEIYNT